MTRDRAHECPHCGEPDSTCRCRCDVARIHAAYEAVYPGEWQRDPDWCETVARICREIRETSHPDDAIRVARTWGWGPGLPEELLADEVTRLRALPKGEAHAVPTISGRSAPRTEHLAKDGTCDRCGRPVATDTTEGCARWTPFSDASDDLDCLLICEERLIAERDTWKRIAVAAQPVLQASGRVYTEAVLAMYPKGADDDR